MNWILAGCVGMFFCMLVVVIGIRAIMQKHYEKAIIEYQNKVLSQEMEEVQNMYLTMRGWRHDYHNHMQSLKAYLVRGNTAEACAYMDRLETELDGIRMLFQTGNLNVDAILNAKISLAMKQGIPCDYTVLIPEILTIRDTDLCILLGNLIDNAVESCRSLSENQKFLRLYMAPMQEQLYISVSNATGEQIRKLDEAYITGKRGDHGHGLKRINQVVDKYQGYINRKNEPGVFVTEVMIPL